MDGPAVSSEIKRARVADPLGRDPDPWADFREVLVIGLEWSQTYKHSLGKYSRFFTALENGRFLATHCSRCAKTWAPPRPACPACLAVTAWRELSGRGALISWSVLHHAPKMLADVLTTPYVLAYVRLDGADTLFGHLLRGVADPATLRHGQAVRVAYADGPVDHPMLLMTFELDEAS